MSDCLPVLQQLAAVLLLAALAAFLLQATARQGLAAGRALDRLSVVEHGCDHAHAGTGATQAKATEACNPAASIASDNCCQQLCTVAALLPQALSDGGSPSGEVFSGRWSNRVGWSPAAILRPPRTPAVA